MSGRAHSGEPAAIRRATAADVDALVELRTALFTEIGRLGPDPAEVAWFRDANRAYLAESIPAGSFLAWVAEVDGRVVATSGLVLFPVPPQPENPGGLVAYVMNMYTRPGYRRRGIAKAVLEAILAHVKATTAGHVLLLTTPTGRGLYARAGFDLLSRAMELHLPR